MIKTYFQDIYQNYPEGPFDETWVGSFWLF